MVAEKKNDYILFGLESQIIIYGAGEVGVNLAGRLLCNNYRVRCFWDQKGNGAREQMTKLPVVSDPREIRTISQTDDSIVIICLANGNLHYEVAEMIYEQGFKYIVFLPLMSTLDIKEKVRLIDEYNSVLAGNEENIVVYDYGMYRQCCGNCEQALYKAERDMVWSYLPIELLYTESIENWKGDKKKVTGRPETFDRNIIFQRWYRHLFRFFRGEEQSADLYFQSFKTKYSDIVKRERLLDREMLNVIYENEYKRGMTFFESTAPLVEWNEYGYFNLVGGHHRTIFLLEKGCESFPVKMTRSDFDKWSNVDVLEDIDVCDYSSINGILEVPIPHPSFLNNISKRVSGINRIFERVFLYLEDKNNVDNIVDASCADGFFARNMYRMKKQRVACVDKEPERLENLLKLIHIGSVDVYASIEQIKTKVIDAVFILNPACGEGIISEWIPFIDKVRILFYEYKYREDDSVQQFFASYNLYKKYILALEVYECEQYAVAVFVREDVV